MFVVLAYAGDSVPWKLKNPKNFFNNKSQATGGGGGGGGGTSASTSNGSLRDADERSSLISASDCDATAAAATSTGYGSAPNSSQVKRKNYEERRGEAP